MQDKLCKLSRLAAVLLVFLAACVGSAWASGVPWQVGDMVVCYGGGNCNVIRLHGSTVQVLDTISSGLLGHNSGVGLNNTLHVLATDDGTGTTHSNVVVYSIASINPFNPSVNPLTTPLLVPSTVAAAAAAKRQQWRWALPGTFSWETRVPLRWLNSTPRVILLPARPTRLLPGNAQPTY